MQEKNKKLECWYYGGMSLKNLKTEQIRILEHRSGLEIYRLRILIDTYEDLCYKKRKSFRNTISYLKKKNLIILDKEKWELTNEGLNVLKFTFPFFNEREELTWREPNLSDDDYMAR